MAAAAKTVAVAAAALARCTARETTVLSSTRRLLAGGTGLMRSDGSDFPSRGASLTMVSCDVRTFSSVPFASTRAEIHVLQNKDREANIQSV